MKSRRSLQSTQGEEGIDIRKSTDFGDQIISRFKRQEWKEDQGIMSRIIRRFVKKVRKFEFQNKFPN